MPEFYRNAWYAQLKKKVDELEEEIQKAIELPTVTSADDGKVLTVDNDGKWTAEEVPKELPVVQTTDAGKVLTVDNAGEWSAGISYPINYSTDEKVVGAWVDGKPIYQITLLTTSDVTGINDEAWSTVPANNIPQNIKELITASYRGLTYLTSDYFRFGYNSSSNLITVASIKANATLRAGSYITIQYTKTTD